MQRGSLRQRTRPTWLRVSTRCFDRMATVVDPQTEKLQPSWARLALSDLRSRLFDPLALDALLLG